MLTHAAPFYAHKTVMKEFMLESLGLFFAFW